MTKIRVSKIRVSKIRVREIRVREISVSEIRISSNHRELHGAMFLDHPSLKMKLQNKIKTLFTIV